MKQMTAQQNLLLTYVILITVVKAPKVVIFVSGGLVSRARCWKFKLGQCVDCVAQQYTDNKFRLLPLVLFCVQDS